MRARLLPALTAAIVLGLTTQMASANRLSINERRVEFTFPTFRMLYAGGGQECPVTLQGSFHSSTIAKTAGALVGHISRASINGALGMGSCFNGEATIFQESLPWHLTYRSMTGFLPRPTSIQLNIINARFRIDPLSVFAPACNATTTTAEPAAGRLEMEANGLVTGFSMLEELGIVLESGMCPFAGNIRFASSARVTRLGTTTNIRITLI